MNTENRDCYICHKPKPLFKAIERFLSFRGFEEEIVLVCKECIASEPLKEVIETDVAVDKANEKAA